MASDAAREVAVRIIMKIAFAPSNIEPIDLVADEVDLAMTEAIDRHVAGESTDDFRDLPA